MGIAMRLFAGNWTNGTISVMFENKMKKNIDVSKGMNFLPSGPMVCITTEFSMKFTPDSATCCTPTGTRDSRVRPARPNSAMVAAAAAR